MIRRLGFRRILPLAQLAIFIILVGIGAWQVGESHSGARVQPVAWQEGQNLPDLHPQPQYRMPAAWLIAIAINVPATMLGALCAEILRIGSNIGGLVCSMPFVLLLWQLVGRWLDRQLRFLPFRPPNTATRIACWIGIVFSAALLAIGILAIRSHSALTPEVLSLAAGWLVWSLLLFVMSVLTLRRAAASSETITT
jgi:hypothetical protein